jgi:hypothetical protein
VPTERQVLLLTSPDVLIRFLRYGLLSALQDAGKLKLAVFFDEICASREMLWSIVIRPLLRYQQELQKTGSTVFAASERFQCNKKGRGKKRSWDKGWAALKQDDGFAPITPASDDLVEPGLAHALQLMIYWLAFQIRWDVWERVQTVRGQIEDLAMPLQQELDLIIYNLHDSCQYQLAPTDFQEALLAVTNCIFYLNWAMKSGYTWQAPEHDCGKTQLLTD